MTTHKKENALVMDELAKNIGLDAKSLKDIIREWTKSDPNHFFEYLNASGIKAATERYHRYTSALFDLKENTTNESAEDNPVYIEEFTAEERAASLMIDYFFYDTKFGKALIASTTKGICYIAFGYDETELLNDLKKVYPHALIRHEQTTIHQNALTFFDTGKTEHPLTLHIKGTEFQFKVWRALLTIPSGALATYGDIAGFVGSPGASRAVGTAVGANPVSYVIPCHRVILSSGKLGNYRWDPLRKYAMIAYEASKTQKVL